MQTINYKIHLILHSKYKLFYHFTIIFLIYCMFYGDKLIYCMIEDNNDFRNKFYIYWPGDADNTIDKDVEYYALNDRLSREMLLKHRSNIYVQKDNFDRFILEEHKAHMLHAHNQTWAPPVGIKLRSLTTEYNEYRGYGINRSTIIKPAFLSQEKLDNIIEGFLTRNKKPYVDLDYTGLKITNQTYIDDRGKIVREVSTIRKPFDCFYTNKRYIDVYYP